MFEKKRGSQKVKVFLCESSCGLYALRGWLLIADDMNIGDLVLFYHSNATPPGVAGIGRVCKEAYPDFFSWNPDSHYFDAKSSPDNPRWFMVDVEFVEKFAEIVSLDELKEHPALNGMLVIKRGMRLSVQPVEKDHFDIVVKMGKDKS